MTQDLDPQETRGPFIMASGTPRHERPIWIWDRATAKFVWANGEGIKFWAAPSLEQLQSSLIDPSHPAWITVLAAFEDEIPENGIDLELAFPNGSGIYHYSALCRLGQLKDRTALIVELTGVLPASDDGFLDEDQRSKGVIHSERNLSHDTLQNDIPKNNITVFPSREELHKFEKSEDQTSQEDLSFEISADQLSELADMILNAGRAEKDNDQGHDDDVTESNHSGDLFTSPKDASDCVNKEINSLRDQTFQDHHPRTKSLDLMANDPSHDSWDQLSFDLVALSGAGDQEEIETLLDKCAQPVALVHLHNIIYANKGFVSAFGYGDYNSLGNDGTDWILPESRAHFKAFYDEGRETPLTFKTIRIRSGRKLARPVYIKPLTLVKFDRVFLLIRLGDYKLDTDKQDVDTSELMQHELKSSENYTGLPFLSAVSHEVRTPLNVIHGFAELMAREEFGPLGHNKYLEYVEDIQTSAEHALSLINDLLNLNKLRAGKWDISIGPLKLNEIVQTQVHLMRGLASKEHVRLRASLEQNLPLVRADERATTQILINLLSNSLKYSGAGSVVTAATTLTDKGHVELVIEDTGCGMSEGELEKVLLPFEQSNETALQKGTGLGLGIAKALCEASGIEFSIKSLKDKGTQIQLLFSVNGAE